jgi:hypothetical protein
MIQRLRKPGLFSLKCKVLSDGRASVQKIAQEKESPSTKPIMIEGLPQQLGLAKLRNALDGGFGLKSGVKH